MHYIHPFTHTFIHRGRRKPCKAPTYSPGALGVQSLAQGLFDTTSGGTRDRTGNPSGTLHVLMTATPPLSHAAHGEPMGFKARETCVILTGEIQVLADAGWGWGAVRG